MRIPDLTLEAAINSCRASEASKRQLKELSETYEKSLEEVRVKHTKRKKQSTHGRPLNARAQGKEKPNCKRCGRVHPPKTCPAFDKTCNKCQKKGHFAALCRSKQVQSLEIDGEEFFIGSV